MGPRRRRLLGLQASLVTAFELRTEAFMLFFDVEARRRGWSVAAAATVDCSRRWSRALDIVR